MITSKKILVLSALAFGSITFNPSSASAGYPIFDVSKTLEYVMGLVGRFQPIKEKLTTVKELKEKFDSIKAGNLGDMIKGGKVFGQSFGQTLSVKGKKLSSSGKDLDFKFEKTAKDNGSLSQVNKDYISQFFRIGKSNLSNEEIQEVQDLRKAYSRYVIGKSNTRSLSYIFADEDNRKKWDEQINSAIEKSESLQDAYNANTTVTMAANFQRLSQLLLVVTEAEGEIASSLIAQPVMGYKKPSADVLQNITSEADVDF